MQLHAGGAGALTHDGDIFRVTAESGDVILDPGNGGHLVIQAVVTGEAGFFLQLGQAYKAHRTKAVIQGDTDHALGRPNRLIKVFFVSAAAGKSAAVNVHKHRQFVALFGRIRNTRPSPLLSPRML